ncbi:hypothetical protein R1sor_004075 [Riccia sorocarpa]|uniref:Rhodanese domain-containing protein n=1 Tax=Riccia sorocarpa TaxID=122646 RepID=A0ABD3H3S4_9MARC
MNLFDLMVFMLLNWNSWSVEDLVTVILQDRPESEDSFWAVIQTICSGDLDERPRRDWWVFPKSECWWENLVKQVPEKTLTVPTAHTSSNGRRSRSDRITIKPYLVGDAAYPLTPHIIKAFNTRRTSTAEKNDFDKALRRCRVRIEHTFGLLKSRVENSRHWMSITQLRSSVGFRRKQIAQSRLPACALITRAEVQFVSVEAKEMVEKDGYKILDISDKTQYERSHIPSSVHVPYFIENTDSDIGTEGLRSGYATEKLEGVGFKNVAYINAGLNKVPPGVFSKEGEKELQDAGKGGLVTIQGPVSRVVGIILILAYLFLQFFPDQATEEFRRR